MSDNSYNTSADVFGIRITGQSLTISGRPSVSTALSIEDNHISTAPRGAVLINNDTLINNGTLVIYVRNSITCNSGTIIGDGKNKILNMDTSGLEVTVPASAVYNGSTGYTEQISIGLQLSFKTQDTPNITISVWTRGRWRAAATASSVQMTVWAC